MIVLSCASYRIAFYQHLVSFYQIELISNNVFEM